MLSFTKQRNLFGTLSLNSTANNLAMFDDLANIEHRYLLQKYFSNEGSFSITTVGTQSLTTTVSLAANATSATLSTAWTYHSTTSTVTFSSGDTRVVKFTRNSTAITWAVGLSATATTAISVGGLQYYPVPPNYSKLKTLTVTIGSLTWTSDEVLTREQWDRLNVFPYYGDIPKNHFVYPGGDHGVQVGIWPIPSTTGNTITYNYKFRVPDLSIADYTTPGTVSVAQGGTTVTGVSTTFAVTTNQSLESRWISFAQPTGDNLWYQIDNISSTTALTLYTPYQGIAVSTVSTYTIGQMPILMEDFHDMLLWKALAYYYTSIVDNKDKRKEYQGYYDTKLELLADYAGSKSSRVNLRSRVNQVNPNLFPQTIG